MPSSSSSSAKLEEGLGVIQTRRVALPRIERRLDGPHALYRALGPFGIVPEALLGHEGLEPIHLLATLREVKAAP